MKTFKRRTLIALLAIGVTLGMAPVIAQASFTMPVGNATVSAATTVEPVTYIDKNGKPQTCENYTPISQVADTADGTTGEVNLNGWYVVDQDVTFSTRLRAEGEINLILCDGVTLTTKNGIHVPSSGSLNIYGQSEDTGTLTTRSDESEIGTDTVNSPLGGNTEEEECGTITINGGTIRASSDSSAPAIGSGGDNLGGKDNLWSDRDQRRQDLRHQQRCGAGNRKWAQLIDYQRLPPRGDSDNGRLCGSDL